MTWVERRSGYHNHGTAATVHTAPVRVTRENHVGYDPVALSGKREHDRTPGSCFTSWNSLAVRDVSER